MGASAGRLWVALGLSILALSCGGKSQIDSDDDAGLGGSAGTGGKSGTGGTIASTGGSSTTACDKPGTCELAPAQSCCMSCWYDTQTSKAVYYSKYEEHMKQACPMWPVYCEQCPAQPVVNPVEAFCEQGACAAVDITTHRISECENDGDCMLVVKGCCSTCTPAGNQILAVAKKSAQEYQSQVCNPYMNYACPGCIPTFPSGYSAQCNQQTKHCFPAFESPPL